MGNRMRQVHQAARAVRAKRADFVTSRPRPVETIVKRFLTHSFEPIHFKYDGLTSEEKRLCTREEFEAVVKWL